MNRPKNKLLIAGLMAITSGVFTSSAVQANDLERFFRNYFGTNINNGNPAITQNQLQTMADLNNARARIESKIAAGVASGQISTQQSIDFRAELNQNASTQASYTADGFFAYNEAQSLWNTLNNIESRVQSVLNVPIATGTTYPYGYSNTLGYGFKPTWGRGYTRGYNNINRMQSDVLSMLNRGRSNGFLTASEYNSLKSEYDAIAAREIQMRSSNNRLNYRERQRLVDRLNSLANNISREINDRQVAGRPHRWW